MNNTPNYNRFADIPPFTRAAGYHVNQSWKFLPNWIDDHKKQGLNLDPDFQRAHVWTEEQQIRYVEFRLRGGMTGRDIYFNDPDWNHLGGNSDYKGLVLVDGKQRLNAVMRFLNNEIPAFGTLLKDYEDVMRATTADFIIHINDLPDRKSVLQWYIDLNDGGVAHTSEEIEKVRVMLEAEQ